jgi:hypothetical protein
MEIDKKQYQKIADARWELQFQLNLISFLRNIKSFILWLVQIKFNLKPLMVNLMLFVVASYILAVLLIDKTAWVSTL